MSQREEVGIPRFDAESGSTYIPRHFCDLYILSVYLEPKGVGRLEILWYLGARMCKGFHLQRITMLHDLLFEVLVLYCITICAEKNGLGSNFRITLEYLGNIVVLIFAGRTNGYKCQEAVCDTGSLKDVFLGGERRR